MQHPWDPSEKHVQQIYWDQRDMESCLILSRAIGHLAQMVYTSCCTSPEFQTGVSKSFLEILIIKPGTFCIESRCSLVELQPFPISSQKNNLTQKLSLLKRIGIRTIARMS